MGDLHMNETPTGLPLEWNTSASALFGHDETPGIVALEPIPGRGGRPDEMRLYVRQDGATKEERDRFTPFLWMNDTRLLDSGPVQANTEALQGSNPLKALALFGTWKELEKAVRWLKETTGRNPSDRRAPYFLINDPVQQYLLLTGRTLFKDLRFQQIKRMQVDIETYHDPDFEFPNADRPTDRVIAIALADETGWTHVIRGDQEDERTMLEAWVELVQQRDPDVIEGHNIFKFDLAYLQRRAAHLDVPLALGRNGATMKVRSGRYVAAEQTITYPKADIYGRHVVDTYFLAQAYDISHRSLESLGLKDVAIHFDVAAEQRTYIPGSDIARVFDQDPDKVMAYARDDILETRAVSDILSPSYFVQAQLLPFSYQNIAVRGTGSKVDALLLRAYLHRRHGITHPDETRTFAGGYTDIFLQGVAKNVHHCDVRSLYPSLMLLHGIKPTGDELDLFLLLLKHLRQYRLDAKARMQRSTSKETVRDLDALQSTFKILINSFYGYLGFAQGRFSDYGAAEQVAAEGRALLHNMIEWIRELGGSPVEIDTDGIYFVPPPYDETQEIEQFRAAFQAKIPQGIDVEFDGEYAAMFSYKIKNYALLSNNGEITIKGAALKSRGLEPFQRTYLRTWLEYKLQGRDDDIVALQEEMRRALLDRIWPITMLAKTETLQDSPANYKTKVASKRRGRNAAYELALQSDRDFRAGDQISYYVTGNKKSVPVYSHAKLVTAWSDASRDENIPFYQAKLEALFNKFEACESDAGQGTFDLQQNGGVATYSLMQHNGRMKGFV